MAFVIREWLCRDCGEHFESSDSPEEVFCPSCAAVDPERVFLTAPAIKSGKTSTTDEIVSSLAADYKLTDMSNRDGQAVKRAKEGKDNPYAAQFSPQAMNMISRLGKNADQFSPMMPMMRGRGPNSALPPSFPFAKQMALKPK